MTLGNPNLVFDAFQKRNHAKILKNKNSHRAEELFDVMSF